MNNLFYYIDIPPSYEEAITNKPTTDATNYSSHEFSSIPIHSISLLVDQAETPAGTTSNNNNNVTTDILPNRKRTSLNTLSQQS